MIKNDCKLAKFNYLFEEVFIAYPCLYLDSTEDFVITKTYEDLSEYIRYAEIVNEATNLVAFHGTIIPAEFIYRKMNNLTNIWLLKVDTVNLFNTPTAKESRIDASGILTTILPFFSLEDVKDFIEEKINIEKWEMESLYIFMGYEVNNADKITPEDIDESEIGPVLCHANVIKEIMTYTTAALDAIIKNGTVGETKKAVKNTTKEEITEDNSDAGLYDVIYNAYKIEAE